MKAASREIVLASSSPYRRDLLARLGMDYAVHAPDIDETPLQHESPVATATRLAQAKARKIAAARPSALIIGSDQVALLDNAVIGKPLTHAAAVRQLRAMSGRVVVFHTAVCLLDAFNDEMQCANVPTTVHMRELQDDAIERYLRRDRPYDCAGSAKIEALGISLVEKMQTEDPTALIGLPLITLVTMLKRSGVAIP
jgi:septum formation protein